MMLSSSDLWTRFREREGELEEEKRGGGKVELVRFPALDELRAALLEASRCCSSSFLV